MMGFGYLGNGGPSSSSSSSSSNLSPLAPPFTVDRFNPKPNSNPLTNFTEPPSYSVPFSSPLHNWQYVRSSASRHDFFPICDPKMESARTPSLPSANNYCFLDSDSINPPSAPWVLSNPTPSNPTNPFSCAPKQYYSPYASQVVADDTSLVGLNEANYDLLSSSGLVPMVGSSQVDYTRGSSVLEFPPPWGSFWNGADGKRGERTGTDGSVRIEKRDVGSHVNKDCKKQGAVAVESWRKSEENPAISHTKYDDFLGRDNFDGTPSKNDKFVVQNLGGIPIESSRAPILGSGTISTESYLEPISLEPTTFSCNHQESCSPYGKRFQLFDSFVNDCLTGTKSSPTCTIRPAVPGSKPSAADTVSSKILDIGNDAATNSKDVSSQIQSIEKEPDLPLSSEGKEGCLNANHLSFHIGRNDHHIFAAASWTKEELSDKLLCRNALDRATKTSFGAQVPDINAALGFSAAVDSTETFKHTANSSENLDHHNPAEDSPCWKGAPASHVSPFETLEATHLMKKTAACADDTVKAFSREVRETSLQKESLCSDNSTSRLSKRNSNANSPAKDHTAVVAATTKSGSVELNRSDGVQFSDNFDSPIKEYDLLNGSKGNNGYLQLHTGQLSPKEVKFTSKRKLQFQNGVVDAGFSTSVTSQDGCVPVHAKENVLCPPSSVEDTIKPHGMESSPIMNVQMLVNTMHNLSELLLYQCSGDSCALKEQDYKALEHAIKNIDVCLLKKIGQSTPTQESMLPMEEHTSQLFEGVHNLHMGAGAVMPQVMNSQLDSQCSNELKRKCDLSGKKFEKNLDFVSSRDDADGTKCHNMVQGIKKALDDNFQLDKDVPSQTMFYKNMWLDAEAELCSIGFRARFDRVKLQMGNCKSDTAKDFSETTMAVEKLPTSNMPPDLNITCTLTPEDNDIPRQKTSVQNSYISSPTSHVEDSEASVMARFHILKCRGDNSNTINNVEEKQLPEVVDVGISGKRNHGPIVGNQTGNNSFDVAVGSRLQHNSSHVNEEKIGSDLDNPQHETVKDFLVRVTDDASIQPHRCNMLQNQLAPVSGWYESYDNSSSDWEHVLKDDFTWQT